MQITVDIPESVAEQIIPAGMSPPQAVLEALALEGYRTRRLSEYQVQQMLGLQSRFVVHAFLNDHQTCLNYSVEDYEKDLETLRRVDAAQQGNAKPSPIG